MSQKLSNSEEFYQYMLRELNASAMVSQHVSDASRQFEQFYLTAMSAIVAGGLLLITAQSRIDPLIIVAFSFLLIALFGIQLTLRKAIYWEQEVYQSYSRIGLHRYFKQLDPVGFEQFGRQLHLERNETPYHWTQFGRAPWKNIKLIGYFATIHGILLGVGLGIVTSAIVEFLPLPLSIYFPIEILILPFVTVVVFLIYLYVIAREVQRKHVNLQNIYKKMLQTYQEDTMGRV